jgi:hypothetical protein
VSSTKSSIGSSIRGSASNDRTRWVDFHGKHLARPDRQSSGLLVKIDVIARSRVFEVVAGLKAEVGQPAVLWARGICQRCNVAVMKRNREKGAVTRLVRGPPPVDKDVSLERTPQYIAEGSNSGARFCGLNRIALATNHCSETIVYDGLTCLTCEGSCVR